MKDLLSSREFTRHIPAYAQVVQVPVFEQHLDNWSYWIEAMTLDYNPSEGRSDIDKAMEFAVSLGEPVFVNVVFHKLVEDDAFGQVDFASWYYRYQSDALHYYLCKYGRSIPGLGTVLEEVTKLKPFGDVWSIYQAQLLILHHPTITLEEATGMLVSCFTYGDHLDIRDLKEYEGSDEGGYEEMYYPVHCLLQRFGASDETVRVTFELIETHDPQGDYHDIRALTQEYLLASDTKHLRQLMGQNIEFWKLYIYAYDRRNTEKQVLKMLQEVVDILPSNQHSHFVTTIMFNTALFAYTPSHGYIRPYVRQYVQDHPNSRQAQASLEYINLK